jgi:hypothetical protein
MHTDAIAVPSINDSFQAVERDKGKKGKISKKRKKGKKGNKKGKKKKDKDLTPDRTTESLFEELVMNNVIKPYPQVNGCNMLPHQNKKLLVRCS